MKTFDKKHNNKYSFDFILEKKLKNISNNKSFQSKNKHNYNDKVYCFFVENGVEWTYYISSIIYISSFVEKGEKIHIFALEENKKLNDFVQLYIKSLSKELQNNIIFTVLKEELFDKYNFGKQKRGGKWRKNYFFVFNFYLVTNDFYKDLYLLHLDTILVNGELNNFTSSDVVTTIGPMWINKDNIERPSFYKKYAIDFPKYFNLTTKVELDSYYNNHCNNTGFLYINNKTKKRYSDFLQPDMIKKTFKLTKYAEQEYLTIFLHLNKDISVKNNYLNEAIMMREDRNITEETSHIHLDHETKFNLLTTLDPISINNEIFDKKLLSSLYLEKEFQKVRKFLDNL